MNIYDSAKITIGELYNSAYNFFSEKYQKDSKQFSLASAWGQLLNSMHELTRLNIFYIEDSITELNSETALRSDNIRGLSTLTGHVPYLGNASNGVLMISRARNGKEFNGENLVIPNHTQLKCKENGLTYSISLPGDYTILSKDFSSLIDLKIVQGIFEDQSGTGTGENLQTLNFSIDQQYFFDHDTINVFVNGSKWDRVNSLLEMSYDSTEYYVKSSITGGITLFFGNGTSGSIPVLGSDITVSYLKHQGNRGNISLPSPTFEFIEPQYDSLDNEVEANKLFMFSIKNQVIFGSNPETPELTKQLMNRIDRSNVLYTPQSFEIFLKKYNMFSIVHAFKTTDDNIIQDDNIVYILLVSDVQKRLSANSNYYNMPLDKFGTTDTEKERLKRMINESGRKPSSIDISILEPALKKYVININIIAYEEFLNQEESIKETIKETIANYFIKNTRKDRIPRSDIIRILEDVPGVDSVSVVFISEANENNKKMNPTTTELIGLDLFNDIVLKQDELPIIRGGWTDAKGVKYSEDVNDTISMVNIVITK